jgi:hypothetical protein
MYQVIERGRTTRLSVAGVDGMKDLSQPSAERSKLAIELLDKIADTVLAYRPKSKAKKPRKRKKAKRARS